MTGWWVETLRLWRESGGMMGWIPNASPLTSSGAKSTLCFHALLKCMHNYVHVKIYVNS